MNDARECEAQRLDFEIRISRLEKQVAALSAPQPEPPAASEGKWSAPFQYGGRWWKPEGISAEPMAGGFAPAKLTAVEVVVPEPPATEPDELEFAPHRVGEVRTGRILASVKRPDMVLDEPVAPEPGREDADGSDLGMAIHALEMVAKELEDFIAVTGAYDAANHGTLGAALTMAEREIKRYRLAARLRPPAPTQREDDGHTPESWTCWHDRGAGRLCGTLNRSTATACRICAAPKPVPAPEAQTESESKAT